MNSLSDILNSLRGKEISVTLTSGKVITGALSEVLTDTLIMNNLGDQLVVVINHITMIREQKKGKIGEKPPGL